MHPTTRRLICTTAAAVAVALPGAAGAQQPLDPVQVTARASRADKLEAQAAAYEKAGNMRRFGKAAGLYERAAGLRAAEERRGFASLQRAAFLRYAVRQPVAAGDLMERAGDQALARGDVFNAAGAYIDAAYVAAELREPARVRELVRKGTLLMHSPLLSAPERHHLQGLVAAASPRLGIEVAAATHP